MCILVVKQFAILRLDRSPDARLTKSADNELTRLQIIVIRKFMKHNKLKAFTLLELLVVINIGILISLPILVMPINLDLVVGGALCNSTKWFRTVLRRSWWGVSRWSCWAHNFI